MAVAAAATQSTIGSIAIMWLILFTTSSFASTVTQTKIYINTISGYSQLSSCATYPLSTIVRDMKLGCGDGGRLTSYACFCTSSSSRMSANIAAEVPGRCNALGNATSLASAQAKSANAVFHSYCLLGVDAGLTASDLGRESNTSACPQGVCADA